MARDCGKIDEKNFAITINNITFASKIGKNVTKVIIKKDAKRRKDRSDERIARKRLS